MSTAIYKHLDYFGNRSDTMGVHYLCKLAHCSLNTYGLLGLGLQDHGQQGLPCCTWLPSRFWRHWLPSRLWLWLRFSFAWRRWLHCRFWQLDCHFWLHDLLWLGLQDHRRQGLPCCSWLPRRFWRHWLPSRLWRRWRQLRSLGLQMIAASESHIVVQKIIFRKDDRCLCFIEGMLGVDSLGHLQTFVNIPNVLLSLPKAPLGSRPAAGCLGLWRRCLVDQHFGLVDQHFGLLAAFSWRNSWRHWLPSQPVCSCRCGNCGATCRRTTAGPFAIH